MQKQIVVITKKFGFITGHLQGKKTPNGNYSYTMIESENGNRVRVLGEFTVAQLAKVKKLEDESQTYDYSSIV